MNLKNYCLLSAVLFTLVAAAHLTRIVLGLSIYIDEYMFPMWISWLGVIFPGFMAVWSFIIVNEKT